jgi:glyoxylase-like metal-dependent hydrolase (beta-lactamase superfamily II)
MRLTEMAVRHDRPGGSSAAIHVLFEGYVDTEVTPFSVASTVTYVRDGDTRLIIDPGLVPSHRSILDPLKELGVDPAEVTDVVFSHHHPDHTLNAALFPNARIHDHWAIYRNDTWAMRPAEGFDVSSSVRLIETPGHTPQCITTLVGMADDVAAFTHLWWSARGPDEDPFAVDPKGLHAGRARILEVATLIVPGHGAPFVPDDSTPR